ncbi:type II secretion system protein [Photobacterium carnosum]|uniref:type II secretion system protein n=1 Tax=Photobacterium carnosum TaxID=2023717 RepID=UPI00128C90E5|nr:prepilin-type N-terminal cleavage/methylation domain-containing protein [Photobacterium carnosum]KAE8177439.1 hypothetical protein CIT27_06820 [Photobacterium carnosum]
MRNKGFTLIELVVVIVILGILAVVAAPKFMGLQREARIADLKGLEGSLKAANEMVYAKAAMKGLEHSSFSEINTSENKLEINGRDVILDFWHIVPGKSNIKTIIDISEKDWNIQGGNNKTPRFSSYMTPKTASGFNGKNSEVVKKSKCYLSYGFPQTSPEWEIPEYHLVTSGC